MDWGPKIERGNHPKDSANIFSIISFAYIFKFLRRGRKQQMKEDDLTNVMNNMRTKPLADELETCWMEQKKDNSKPGLMRAIMKCFGFSMFVLFSSNLFFSLIQAWAIPWSIGKFVSYFQKERINMPLSEAVIYAVIILVTQALSSLWIEHYHLLKAELGIRIETSVSSLLYRKLLTIDQTTNRTITTGGVITRLTKDISNIREVVMILIENVSDVAMLIFTIFLLYQKLEYASLSGVLIIILTTIIQVILARMTYTYRGICNQKGDERLGQIQEVLSSIRLIKMYGWEDFFGKKLLLFRKIELESLCKLFTLRSLSRILGTTSSKLSYSSTLLLSLWLGNGLNADVIYYTKSCFQRASKALIFLPMGLQVISESLMASKRLNVILQAEENQATLLGTPSSMEPEIIFRETDIVVDNSTILKNINLKLEVGLNVLVGPSGSGKTSLLKTILEEYPCQSGKKNVRGTISYVPQESWLFPSSLKQNILFGQSIDEEKYNKVLDMCGLTYDISTFLLGDEMVLSDCGANLSGGQQTRINLARALYRDADIYIIDDCLASLDVHIKNHVFENAIKRYLGNKLCLLVTHSSQFIDQADHVIIMDEGTVKYSGKPFNISVELPNVKIETEEKIEIINEEVEENDEAGEETSLMSKNEHKQKGNIHRETNNTGKVGFHVYKSYFQFGGGYFMIFAIAAVYFVSELLQATGEKLLSHWVNVGNATKTTMTDYEMTKNSSIAIGITLSEMYSNTPSYTSPGRSSKNLSGIVEVNSFRKDDVELYYSIGTTFGGAFIAFFGILICVFYGLRIARNIYKNMIYNLLNGCMSFFDTHLSGSILTRFSRDLYILDERLPAFWNATRNFFALGMCLILIGSIGFVFLGMSIILAVLLYCITDFVLSTTRNLQRLNSSTLSPVLGHVNATLKGLTIIRTHGIQNILKYEYDKHLDLNMTASHLKEISNKCMLFYCHLAGLIYSTFVMTFLLFMEGTLAGDVGLLLNQTHTLTFHLEILLVLWTLMENNMTNVERILEYQNLPKEIRTKGRVINNWPSRGEIRFQNLSLVYRNNETVLKNLNFVISSQQKIGIVGRTGAGKSSIIMTLYRLYDFSGTLLIDGIDIKTLSIEFLRSHLAIIPQDPVIYTGTLRTNIDPYGVMSDEDIWRVLEIVNLKDNFESLHIDLKRTNLSVGQKQLISIARALTKDTKIVILDEATANMDEEMDSVINEKINILFQSCTVITIAHKLKNVLNNDKIIVLDEGEVVEFDSPQNLLNNVNGIFYKMVHQNTNSE